MHPTLQSLLPGPVVTDGAWGTQLQLMGLPVGDCAERWNLDHPDRVERVGRAYVEAGSQVILTNSLGANRVRLAYRNLGDRTVEINHAAVEISRRAAGGAAYVFASIGPTGKLISMRETTPDELMDVFAEQARAQAEAGADALLLETFTDLDEIVPALTAARTTRLPIVASMVFDSGIRHDRTLMGKTPEQTARAMVEAGADVVGANCGRGVDGYVDVCRRMRAEVAVPLWLKPNAGLPELVDGRASYTILPDQFASRVVDLVEAGADFVGGCCGTDPDFIRAIARSLAG